MTETGALGGTTRRLIVLVAAQILFLLAIASSYWAVGWWGREIRLQTIPIDPRDMLYGDYVTLGYEMSRLPRGLWKGEEGANPKRGEVVYVVLKPDSGGIYRPEAAFGSKPSANGDEVVMKGRVDYSSTETIAVSYGLERYYVPEGTGKALEEQARNMIVSVKIAPWGQSRITGLETS